jgi:MFS family permease
MEPAPAAPDRRWTLVAVCTTTFMLLLDITVVNVALPNIQHDLHASLTGLQWVVDAYALTLAALILTAGALADRYGRRLLFIVGVVVFTLSSLVCGLAWSIAVLDIARAVQGIGGAIAVWGATIGVAVASGPLVGGILTDAFNWRWVFFVNVPVGAFALFVALTRMRESRDPQAVRTDVWGLLTFSASLFLIVFGVLRGNGEGWSSALILSSLIGGAVLLAVFVAVEHRQARPMLDLDLFSHPAFVGISVATFCIGAGMFALFPLPLDLPAGRARLLAARRRPPLPATDGLRRAALDAETRAASVAAVAARRRPCAGRGGARVDARAHAELTLDRAPTRPDRGRHRHRARKPGNRRGGAPRCRPIAHREASGINNACRLTGVAVGVAALGAVLEDRISSSLVSSLGPRAESLGSAVAATGTRVAASNPSLAHPATVAFVSGLNTTLLVSCAIVAVGALAAGLLMRS